MKNCYSSQQSSFHMYLYYASYPVSLLGQALELLWKESEGILVDKEGENS